MASERGAQLDLGADSHNAQISQRCVVQHGQHAERDLLRGEALRQVAKPHTFQKCGDPVGVVGRVGFADADAAVGVHTLSHTLAYTLAEEAGAGHGGPAPGET